jgi:hypothetical protein
VAENRSPTGLWGLNPKGRRRLDYSTASTDLHIGRTADAGPETLPLSPHAQEKVKEKNLLAGISHPGGL